MLTEICAYLHNYFDYERFNGKISIEGGNIFCDGKEITLEEGQYFALFRKRIALGVYNAVPEKDKTFEGSVWLMDVPDAILDADKWAEDWMKVNGGVESASNSAFQSESFGGYSYNKGTNANGKGGMSVFDNSQFYQKLAPYRKLP